MRARRLILAVAGGVLGFAVFGLATATIGGVLGYLSAKRRQLSALTAVSLLVAMALFAVTEQTLNLASFGRFVDSRPLANWSGRLVSLAWMLAVFTGWAEVRASDPDDHDGSPLVAEARRSSTASPGVVGAVGLIAVVSSLIVFGDSTWAWLAIPLVVGSLVLLSALHAPKLLNSDWPAVLQFVPNRVATATSERSDDVLSGSLWMLAGTAVVSIGSFGFWIVAARTATQESVGAAAALFSVVTFLNYATSLGLPVALSRFASDHSISSSVLFTWMLAITTSSSFLGVALFAAVAPGSVNSAIGSAGWVGWLLLALNAAGMSLSVLVDVRCMTLRLWRWFFWRSVAIAVIRLPLLLFVPDDDASMFLFNVVAGAYAVTGLIWLGLLIARSRERLLLGPSPRDIARICRFAIVNYFGQLAIQGPFFAVPLIVLTAVSAEQNASFYLAWGIMSVVVISIQMIGQVLLVEGSRKHEGTGQLKIALFASLGVSVLSFVGAIVFGALVRGLYGPGYEDVSSLLVLLIGGTIPYAVTVIGLSDARVKTDNRGTLVITLAFAALVLVPALILTNGHGAVGASWAWLLGNCAAALVVGWIHFRKTAAFEAERPPDVQIPPFFGGQMVDEIEPGDPVRFSVDGVPADHVLATVLSKLDDRGFTIQSRSPDRVIAHRGAVMLDVAARTLPSGLSQDAEEGDRTVKSSVVVEILTITNRDLPQPARSDRRQ